MILIMLLTGRIWPSSESSPTNRESWLSFSKSWLEMLRMAIAMARSR